VIVDVVLGRHVPGKGLGRGALEHKQVAVALRGEGVPDEHAGAALVEMAGYRNRLAYFYDEVGAGELYEICTDRADEVREVRDLLLAWLRANPQRVDGEL
jgi:uncharacterized protein YutE (UPF0331/DUF86 family)